jgi:hypothetical protein
MAKKILPLLIFLLILVTACSPRAQKVLDTTVDLGMTALDIYQQTGPLQTQIVTQLGPTPTFGISHPIKDYFVLASSSDCEVIQTADIAREPYQSMGCRSEGVMVRYDSWLTRSTMDDVLQRFIDSPRIVLTADTTWHDAENPTRTLGKYYAFTDEDGSAHIIWTVDRASLQGLSGWASRADGDVVALYQWWAEIGSQHK